MSVEVVTFGCRLNAQESEAVKRAALAAGRTDIAIVNTCAVTAEAVAQARQTIRKLARETPDRPVYVTGCAAETEASTFIAMPEVAGLIGNAGKADPSSWLPGGSSNRPLALTSVMEVREIAPHLISAFDGRARAIVQVQNGCDHRCTFCIIPYGRGPSRSVPMGRVVDEVKALVDDGCHEVVLTGVDMTSYGADLPGTPKLGRLVQQILRHVPDLMRLRLSSIDSVEADDELKAAIAHEARLAPHLHLSLQSGDDMILKRMKRRHLREDAIRFCTDMRSARPDLVFGADLIAGFPTEDDAMFNNTLRLVEECGLTYLHVFPFSPRKGTPAARMPQLPGPVIRERAARLRTLGACRLHHHLDAHLHRDHKALSERGGIARLADFTPVRLKHGGPGGEILTIRATHHDGRMLVAA